MKSEYTLHKLPEGFILTSDEDIQIGDLYYLPRTNSIYECKEDPTELNLEKDFGIGKVIAQQDQIDFSALTEEDCKQIGYFDVEKLGMDYASTICDGRIRENISKFNGIKVDFMKGFQKAQELLSDRMFTLEDMELFAAELIGRYRLGEINDVEDVKKIIASYSQPKLWKIEGIWENSKIKITKLL